MLYVTVIVVVLALCVLYFLKQKSDSRSPSLGGPLPYRKKDYLLTKGERAFFDVLLAAVKDEYHLFTKVNMWDLFFLPRGTQNRMKWRGHVSQKHVDFVLCDLRNLKPVLCIELDDKSHEEDDRQKRDVLVDRIFSTSGLPLLHVRASAAYDPSSVKAQIKSVLAPTGATAQ